jgi:hypothetical protein
MEFNLADLFENAVDHFGEREYLVCDPVRYSYSRTHTIKERSRLQALRVRVRVRTPPRAAETVTPGNAPPRGARA